jgi:NOL1/NOP2/fmu family ribosome biogenesis protein
MILLFGFIVSCSDSGTGNETQLYDVKVSMAPSDGGRVSPATDTTVEEGQELKLQAESADEFNFTHWNGDVDSTGQNPLSVTVDQDYSLTVNFELKSYELSTNTDGEGSVSEEVLEEKSKKYEHGTVVELTANPAEGWKFVEWKGNITGTDNPAQITVDDPKEVTAVFEKKNYALTVNTSGEGAVSEEVVQQKSTDYEYGTVVKLTANAAKGWKFVEWSEAKTGTENPMEITIDEPKEVTAVFEKKSYNLSVNTNGEGTIAKDPDQQEYEYNSTVELQADPAEGWQFVEWTGDISSNDNPAELTINTDKEVTAVFEEDEVNLKIVSGNNQYGFPGSTLPNSLKVQAINQHGKGVSDISIEYTIIEGGGTISPNQVKTDNDGFAEATLQLGDGLENTIVMAQVSSSSYNIVNGKVEFTAIPENQSALDDWITDHDRIVEAINWTVSSDSVANYSDWTAKEKSDLNDIYLKVVNNNLDMDNYPPENLYTDYYNSSYPTMVSREDAWELYLMNIANSIAVERNNKVSWSILSNDYTHEDLEILFDSRQFFSFTSYNGKNVYRIVSGQEEKGTGYTYYTRVGYGRVMPSHPQVAMDFFTSEGILSSSRQETIYRLVDWSAVNLRHYTGSFSDRQNIEEHWHYIGAIPVDRIIEGTDRKGDNTDEIYHLTAGCHGTNDFYISILRNLNIPVRYQRKAGHATPYFTVDNLFLSHGDDPYNNFYNRKPAIHPKELMLDEQTWENWFGASNTDEEKLNNIGRRTTELGVEYLSHYLLQLYCADKSYEKSKEEGQVFEALSNVYDMSELEEMNLWEEMDDKLSSIGGCDNINREKIPYY